MIDPQWYAIIGFLVAVLYFCYWSANTDYLPEPLDLTNVSLPITVIRFKEGPVTEHECGCSYGLKKGDILSFFKKTPELTPGHGPVLIANETCDCGARIAIGSNSKNFHQAKVEFYKE